MVVGCDPNFIGILNPFTDDFIHDDLQLGGGTEVGALFYFVMRDGLFLFFFLLIIFIYIF